MEVLSCLVFLLLYSITSVNGGHCVDTAPVKHFSHTYRDFPSFSLEIFGSSGNVICVDWDDGNVSVSCEDEGELIELTKEAKCYFCSEFRKSVFFLADFYDRRESRITYDLYVFESEIDNVPVEGGILNNYTHGSNLLSNGLLVDVITHSRGHVPGNNCYFSGNGCSIVKCESQF